MRKLYISDFSLAVLNEDRGGELLFREKTAVASVLDGFNADAVELYGIRRPTEDRIIIKTISSLVKNSTVCIPAGNTREDIETAWDCICEAASPCLQIILPVSTVQMEYMYHVKNPAMIGKISELCGIAGKMCDRVEFVALDATRADRAFLAEAIRTAVENGANMVTLCDDMGDSLPEEIAQLVRLVKENCNVPLYVKPSDKLKMAVACAAAAIAAGADGIKCAVSGRDVLRTSALADLISARGESLGVYSDIKNTQIHRDIDELMKKVSVQSPVEKPESSKDYGRMIFDMSTDSGKVSEAASSLGYELSADDVGKVHEAILQLCEKKDYIGAKEFEAVIASYAMQVPSTYHLDNYVITTGSTSGAMANVVLARDGEKINAIATGDGPIDAVFLAIERGVGYHYELDDFQIQAVTEGKEALGSSIVRLRSDSGRLYSGTGLSTDIVGASIRAYINALNKIIYEEIK